MENRLKQLQRWALSNGAQCAKIGFQSFEGYGNGGVLEKEMETGETIISIPLKCSMHFDAGLRRHVELRQFHQRHQEKWNAVFSKNEQSNNFTLTSVILYLFLLKERENENSFFAPYLNSLSRFIDTPLFWSTNVINILKGTNMYISVVSLRKKIRKLFEFLKKCDFSFTVTLSSLQWAYSIVWSRSFPVLCGDLGKIPTLLPFVDVLNHKFGQQTEYHTDLTTNTFHLKTCVDLRGVGTQVFNNYGGKANSSFLLSYGFVIEGNTEDTIYVKLGSRGDYDQRCTEDCEFYLRVNDKEGLEKLTMAINRMILSDSDRYFHSDGDMASIKPRSLIRLKELLENCKQRIKFDPSSSPEFERFSKKWKIATYVQGQHTILASLLKLTDSLLQKCFEGRVPQMRVSIPRPRKLQSSGIRTLSVNSFKGKVRDLGIAKLDEDIQLTVLLLYEQFVWSGGVNINKFVPNPKFVVLADPDAIVRCNDAEIQNEVFSLTIELRGIYTKIAAADGEFKKVFPPSKHPARKHFTFDNFFKVWSIVNYCGVLHNNTTYLLLDPRGYSYSPKCVEGLASHWFCEETATFHFYSLGNDLLYDEFSSFDYFMKFGVCHPKIETSVTLDVALNDVEERHFLRCGQYPEKLFKLFEGAVGNPEKAISMMTQFLMQVRSGFGNEIMFEYTKEKAKVIDSVLEILKEKESHNK